MSTINTRNTTVGALGVALAGLVLSSSAFAMQPLVQGYMVVASHAAAEGKCGEGKCGGNEAKPTKTAAVKKTAEGKCGEGKCGDEKFAQIDTDDDARVSKAEFLAVAPGQDAVFAQKDTDHDGYISEMESYVSIKATYESNGKKLPNGLFAKHPQQ